VIEKGVQLMAKLYFKYGVMGSSKSANALMTRFNYMERGCNVLLIKPAIDTRDYEIDESGIKHAVVHSRIGLSAPVDVVGETDSVLELLRKRQEEQEINVIIVDECQFMSESQVEDCRYIASYFDMPVLCFGLRTDFQTRLFPGSKRLMELADTIDEVKHICSCMDKSIVNARMDAMGNVITEGAQVEIGGDDRYEAMCWRCWNDRIGTRTEVEF
jgi:thymidine kinase